MCIYFVVIDDVTRAPYLPPPLGASERSEDGNAFAVKSVKNPTSKNK